MFDHDPLGERATRDVVSRAIYAEMQKETASPNGGVFISMAHLGPEKVRPQFKGMVRRCADCGFDLAAGKVEVVPTAHYFMGGVVVDPIPAPAWRVSTWPGRTRAAPMAPTAWAATAWRIPPSTAGIAGDVMAADLRRMGALRDPDEALLGAEVDRALQPLFEAPRSAPGLA